MLRIKYFVFCVVVLFVFLQAVTFVSAQDNAGEQVSSGVQSFKSLTLEIVVPEKNFLSLEPIPIIIKQSNKTGQPALGYKGLQFGLTPIRLYATKVNSNKKTALGSQSGLAGMNYFVNAALAPGERYETNGLIKVGLDRYFPEPGVYELQAALANDEGTQLIESNKVSIEIKMPTGADRTAYNLIKNSSLEDYLFSGMQYEKGKATLETLTTVHRNSVYAKYGFFLLGETYFDKKQYSQALLNLINLEHDENFIFKDKVKKYLKKIRNPEEEEQ